MTQPIYVFNGDVNNFSITYHVNGDQTKRKYLESQWKSFNRYDPAMAQTYKILSRFTNPNMEVTVDHFLPSNAPAGKYRVETFIPTRPKNSRKVIFTITHTVKQVNGSEQEEYSLVVVDMLDLNDTWYTLGEFHLDPSQGKAVGRVRQYDLSLEDPSVEASYGPVRWVPQFTLSGKRSRFDSPVGTKNERNSSFPAGRVIFGKYPIWVGNWFDVNPFLNWYSYGYHTGADLNLPGSSAADKGKEIYSIGDGIVTFAGRAGSWGNIIVIAHPDAKITLPSGQSRRQPVFSRYGHVDNRILVRTGAHVKRGDLIGYIGLAANTVSGWHLHFDICYTDLLRKRPAHWPNMDTIRALRMYNRDQDSRGYSSAQSGIKKEVMSNYLDPFLFIRENHG